MSDNIINIIYILSNDGTLIDFKLLLIAFFQENNSFSVVIRSTI